MRRLLSSMLYILCFAVVTLSSALKSERSAGVGIGEIVDMLNDQLEYNDFYGLEKVSHVCQFLDGEYTTVAAFLTLTRTQCQKQESTWPAFFTCCTNTEKRKFLHCVMLYHNMTDGSIEPLGYICERGTNHEETAFFKLNKNCSSLLYDTSKSVIQVKLSPESQQWKDKLPLYVPIKCKWNSTTGDYKVKGTKEPPSEKRTKGSRSEKRPKNPLGRQGISGRGKFPHLGENAFILPVIVRREAGQLQVVAQRNSEVPFNISLPWIPYPAYFYQEPVGRNLTRYLFEMWNMTYETRTHFDYFLAMEQEIIYTGPIHDMRNTDDAWLAIRFSVIDDSTYEFMTAFPPDSEFHWTNITDDELIHIKTSFVDVKKKIFL